MKTASPLIFLAAAAALAVLAGLSPAPAAPSDAGRDDAQRLRVITETNIFLRDRRRYVPRAPIAPPRPVSTQPTTQPVVAAPPPPPPAYRLMGVADRDGGFVAYFEDASTGRLVEVQAGQELARGTVTSVTIFGVTHREGSKITKVRVGEGLGILTGMAWRPPSPAPSISRPTGRPTGAPPTTAPATGAATAGAPVSGSPPSASRPPSSTPPASGDVADILERLRRRREQELNK